MNMGLKFLLRSNGLNATDMQDLAGDNTIINNDVYHWDSNTQSNGHTPKFGTTSLATMGGGDYLLCTPAFDWHTHANMDFTIECWVYKQTSYSDQTSQIVLGCFNDNGSNILLLDGNLGLLSIGGYFDYDPNLPSHYRLSSGTPSQYLDTNVWQHVAIVKRRRTIQICKWFSSE